MRWIDVGLPRPECQVEVAAPTGGSFFIDIGCEEPRRKHNVYGHQQDVDGMLARAARVAAMRRSR